MLHVKFTSSLWLIFFICIKPNFEVQTLHTSLIIKENSQPFLKSASKLICCIDAHVIYVYFYFETKYHDLDSVKFLKYLTECSSAPVAIRKTRGNFQNVSLGFTATHVFILPSVDESIISTMLKHISRQKPRKRFLKYVIIFESHSPENIQNVNLLRLFRGMFSRNILHAIAAFGNETTGLNIFGYIPYPERNFRLLNLTERICEANLFFDKLTNLHYQSLNISMFQDAIRAIPLNETHGFSGVDGHLAKTIVNRLNATATYVPPSDGNFYGMESVNGSLTGGAICDVVNRKTEVNFNSRYLIHPKALSRIEHTSSYDRDVFCLVIPIGKLSPTALNFFRTLSEESWIAIGLSLLLIIPVVLIVQRIHEKITGFPYLDHNSPGNVVKMIVQSFLGDSLTKMARSIPLRILMVFWFFYSLLTTNLFLGKLASSLAVPKYEEKLNKLSELKNFNGNIGLAPGIEELLTYTLDRSTFHVLQSKFLKLNGNAFDQLEIRRPGMAYVMRKDQARYFVVQNYNEKLGTSTYRLFDECLAFLPRIYVVQRGSALLEKFDHYISLFYEGGFMQHWSSITESEAIVKGKLSREEDAFDESDDIHDNDDDEWKEWKVILTMEHLQSAFYIWMIGLTVALTVFTGEIFYFRRTRSSVQDQSDLEINYVV